MAYMPRVALDTRYIESGEAAGGVLAGTYPSPSLAADRVRLAGDTMTGPLSITTTGSTAPYLNLSSTDPAVVEPSVTFNKAGSLRWILKSAYGETGSNVGSDFLILGRTDAGASLVNPVVIKRSTGLVTLNNGLNVAGGLTFGNQVGATLDDLSKHISLYGGSIGFNVTDSTINYNIDAGCQHRFRIGGAEAFRVGPTNGATVTGALYASGHVGTGGNFNMGGGTAQSLLTLKGTNQYTGIYYEVRDHFIFVNAYGFQFMDGNVSVYQPINVGQTNMWNAQHQAVWAVNSATWTNLQFRFRANTAGNVAGAAYHVEPYGLAPIFRCFGPYGERLDACNSPNTAYVSLNASAFTVQSSARIKQEIERMEDDFLLDKIGAVRAHRFTPKVRPQTMHWTGKMIEKTGDKEYAFHDHDCDRDPCAGTSTDPCPVTVNDHPKYGLIAEHLHEVLPEVVSYDEDIKPAGYDVDGVAALALGGVGALLRRIEELTARVELLEGILHDNTAVLQPAVPSRGGAVVQPVPAGQ